MKLTVMIPAYNEAKTIAGVVRSIPRNLEGIADVSVLVVNDGSADDTVAEATEAGATVVSHHANKGLGAAFQTGLNHALAHRADILVNIDADGQFDSNDIPRLIAPILADEADFVSANRFKTENGKIHRPPNMPGVKFWGNQRISYLVSMLAGERFPDVSCGFRAYSRKAMLSLNLAGRFTYTQETFLDLASKGLRIATIPIEVKYFKERKSRIAGSVLRYGIKTATIIFKTYRDQKPFTFFGLLALAVFGLGALLDLFILYHYATTGAFSPYRFIAFLGAYLNTIGILLFIVGLVADMLTRIRDNQEKILYHLKKQDYDK